VKINIYQTRWLPRPLPPRGRRTLEEFKKYEEAGFGFFYAVHGAGRIDDYGQPTLDCREKTDGSRYGAIVAESFKHAIADEADFAAVLDDDAYVGNPRALYQNCLTCIEEGAGGFGPFGHYRFMAKYKSNPYSTFNNNARDLWTTLGMQFYSIGGVQRLGPNYMPLLEKMWSPDGTTNRLLHHIGYKLVEFHEPSFLHTRSGFKADVGYTEAWFYERMKQIKTDGEIYTTLYTDLEAFDLLKNQMDGLEFVLQNYCNLAAKDNYPFQTQDWKIDPHKKWTVSTLPEL
jgi:hypothetical protein